MLILSLGVLGPLSSCLITDRTESSKVVEEDETSSAKVSYLISGEPSTTIYEGIDYSYTPDFLEEGATVSALNLPSWVTLNESTGQLSGRVVGYEDIDNIMLIATLNGSYTEIGPFSFHIIGDPLSAYQWHISNTGQSAFAQASGTSGVDLNMDYAVANDITGVGVSIAVSDTGLEITHPDISRNLQTNYHKNYLLSSPYYGDPTNVTIGGDHGTSVAGIIAADGWNSEGGRGVAPGAVVAGLNYLRSDFSTTITYDQAVGGQYIFNYSYGYDFVPYNLDYDTDYSEIIMERFNNARSDRGTIYVKSAGNAYQECDITYDTIYNIDDTYHCFPHSANADPENNIPAFIVVGAVNADGEKSSYSSTGSSLWISAFGGEYGFDEPAIITMDQQGCSTGYSRSVVTSDSSDFQLGEDDLNSDCDYTQTFNGTSAAAPMVSGVIALMLEVNPSLTARDIKHILANTASKISDPTFSTSFPFDYHGIFNLDGYTYEQDWVTNAAGYSYHNHFGFGLIDAEAAIKAAESFTANSLGTQQELNPAFDDSDYDATVGSTIPDGYTTGRSSYIYISEDLTIEAVQVKVNVTHGRPGDLAVELTSPSGTKSILLNAFNSFMLPYDSSDEPAWVADLDDMVLLSNAFYGESSYGAWTIKVIDAMDNSTGTGYDDADDQDGTFDDWSINIVGH